MRDRIISVLATAAVAATACAHVMRPASTLPGEITEYAIPWADAFPSDVVVDSTGVVWFTDRLTHRLGSFDYLTQRFRSYPTRTKKSAPYGITLASDGSIWFAESHAGRIAHFDPKNRRIIREYVIADSIKGPQHLRIAAGRVWFSVRDGNAYGWLDPATGEARLIHTAFMKPYSVAESGDTIVWMSAYEGSGLLLRIDARTAQADTVRVDVKGMRRIATDAAGRVWMTDFTGGRLVSFSPSDSTLHVWDGQRGDNPYGITVDDEGRVWYSESGPARIEMVDPRTGEQRVRQMTTHGAAVRNIAVDSRRGRVWLPMSDRGRIGLILQ